jgi:aminopeptidase-like protein
MAIMTPQLFENYFDRLYPICRSITGNGVRESLMILNEIIPLDIYEVPTGTKCFDWEVPKEWNIEDAYIIAPDGRKIASFKEHNLHIVNYSVPIETELSYDELLPHLHSLPHMPTAIPYYTSYYKETWGFCLSHQELMSLPKEGRYKVYIKSSLSVGSMTYGETILKGETDEEILFSTYTCHPSMANNELSGPLVQAFLYQQIAAMKKRKYTYRFVFAPETIGIIYYLSKHGETLKKKLRAGYVLTCCGDAGDFTYKRSRRINSEADVVAEHILNYSNRKHQVIPFAIGGSDERQYCSPGFNLPVGSIIRTKYQNYDEYHTSLDNKDFISFDAMIETVKYIVEVVRALEINGKYKGTIQYCEPQLGRRNLYANIGGIKNRSNEISNRLHLLNYADGEHTLLEIAELSNQCMLNFEEEIGILKSHQLLE